MHVSFKSEHSVHTERTARAREAAGLPKDGMSLGTRDPCYNIVTFGYFFCFLFVCVFCFVFLFGSGKIDLVD